MKLKATAYQQGNATPTGKESYAPCKASIKKAPDTFPYLMLYANYFIIPCSTKIFFNAITPFST